MKQGDPGYWTWRKNVGRNKKIKGVKHLWSLACEYFERTDASPIRIQEQRKGSIRIDKEAVLSEDFLDEIKKPIIELETSKPYTWAGFEAYLFEAGILVSLDDYKYNTDGRYEEFTGIVRAIDKIMHDQKFSGAAAGIFNANIIARELGLAEKSMVTVQEEQPLFADDDETEEDK